MSLEHQHFENDVLFLMFLCFFLFWRGQRLLVNIRGYSVPYFGNPDAEKTEFQSPGFPGPRPRTAGSPRSGCSNSGVRASGCSESGISAPCRNIVKARVDRLRIPRVRAKPGSRKRPLIAPRDHFRHLVLQHPKKCTDLMPGRLRNPA